MSKTIMVVEDSASIRMVVKITLQSKQYNVIEAVDGQKALDKLGEQKIDLFLCDVNMPNMDGLTFVKKLKQMDEYKFAPVVMLTTESEEAKKQEGKDAGVKAWLIKPFQPDKLLQALDVLLK